MNSKLRTFGAQARRQSWNLGDVERQPLEAVIRRLVRTMTKDISVCNSDLQSVVTRGIKESNNSYCQSKPHV